MIRIGRRKREKKIDRYLGRGDTWEGKILGKERKGKGREGKESRVKLVEVEYE